MTTEPTRSKTPAGTFVPKSWKEPWIQRSGMAKSASLACAGKLASSNTRIVHSHLLDSRDCRSVFVFVISKEHSLPSLDSSVPVHILCKGGMIGRADANRPNWPKMQGCP